MVLMTEGKIMPPQLSRILKLSWCRTVRYGASARIAVVRSDYSASNFSVPGHGRGRSGIGATSSLPRVPAKVPLPSDLPTFLIVHCKTGFVEVTASTRSVAVIG